MGRYGNRSSPDPGYCDLTKVLEHVGARVGEVVRGVFGNQNSPMLKTPREEANA